MPESGESWYWFTVRRRVESWVDLGTAGRVHTPRAEGCKSQWLCDKHNCPQRNSIAGPSALQSDMIPRDHCDLQQQAVIKVFFVGKLLRKHEYIWSMCRDSCAHHSPHSRCELTAIVIPPTLNCSAIISGMRSTECLSSWVESSLNWPGYEMLMLMLQSCWRVDQRLLLKCATFVWAQLSQIQPVNISFAIS